VTGAQVARELGINPNQLSRRQISHRGKARQKTDHVDGVRPLSPRILKQGRAAVMVFLADVMREPV